MRARIFAAALVLSSAVPLKSNEPLTMAVSPAQSFAPTNLAIRVHVEPDAANRALEVVADSGAYYRSSRIQLDGAEAARTIVLEIRNLPGGEYDVRGALIDSTGRERAVVRKQAIVLGSAGSQPASHHEGAAGRTIIDQDPHGVRDLGIADRRGGDRNPAAGGRRG